MLLFRLNVTSKKSTCFKFVLISILNPISLKIFMISFLVLSVCGPVRFRTIISPSSLYRPVSSLSTHFANKERMYTPKSSHTSASHGYVEISGCVFLDPWCFVVVE